jgi:hypothetical protein
MARITDIDDPTLRYASTHDMFRSLLGSLSREL